MTAVSGRPKVTVIIPARYQSTRFPGKPLARIEGKPLIYYSYHSVSRSKSVDRVFVATDDYRIKETAEAFGGEVILTSAQLRTGTDRLAEVVGRLDGEIFINVQGDEILLEPSFLDPLVEDFLGKPALQMATYKKEINTWEDLYNPNIVKVVTDQDGYALYFSRAPIPFLRDRTEGIPISRMTYFRHFGVYIFRRELLEKFSLWEESMLEKVEKLEQLRAMEHGVRIWVKETAHDSLRIDVPDDLKQVEKHMARLHG